MEDKIESYCRLHAPTDHSAFDLQRPLPSSVYSIPDCNTYCTHGWQKIVEKHRPVCVQFYGYPKKICGTEPEENESRSVSVLPYEEITINEVGYRRDGQEPYGGSDLHAVIEL